LIEVVVKNNILKVTTNGKRMFRIYIIDNIIVWITSSLILFSYENVIIIHFIQMPITINSDMLVLFLSNNKHGFLFLLIFLSSKQISHIKIYTILDICVSNNHLKLVDIRALERVRCVCKTIDTSISKIEERECERQEVMNKCW
jgi:hypothetical protein